MEQVGVGVVGKGKGVLVGELPSAKHWGVPQEMAGRISMVAGHVGDLSRDIGDDDIRTPPQNREIVGRLCQIQRQLRDIQSILQETEERR